MRMLCLRFVHELEDDADLDIFKGAVWHGVFGLALKSIDDAAFACLFESVKRVPPWRLIPPRNEQTFIRAGTQLSASLILFNDAIAHAPACATAISQMGDYGFGLRRSTARLESINGNIGDKLVSLRTLFSHSDPAVCGVNAITFFINPIEPNVGKFSMKLLSPMSLKHEGRIQRQPLPIDLIITRLIGRLVGLLPSMEDGFLSTEQRSNLQKIAASVRIAKANTRWLAWERYSGKQKSSMLFGGLVGEVCFEGEPIDVSNILPWLKLAEWLGLGSKTTFGHGQIAIETTQAPYQLYRQHASTLSPQAI